MFCERLLREHLIKRVVPDHDQIARQLNRSGKDLETAEAVIAIDRTWSYTIAYHAMIRAGRSYMFFHGFLPTTVSSHKTIIEFMRESLGRDCSDLILRFDRMRRRRHDFIYDSENHMPEHDTLTAMKTARDLLREIQARVKIGER